ncbi:mCG146839 [Mus musculus]|nr:mCG146839 [Mus musculus]
MGRKRLPWQLVSREMRCLATGARATLAPHSTL